MSDFPVSVTALLRCRFREPIIPGPIAPAITNILRDQSWIEFSALPPVQPWIPSSMLFITRSMIGPVGGKNWPLLFPTSTGSKALARFFETARSVYEAFCHFGHRFRRLLCSSQQRLQTTANLHAEQRGTFRPERPRAFLENHL